MQRAPLVHGGVFDDPDFAENYARKHKGMTEKFGRAYADKLTADGFHGGRIIDVGCGAGGTAIVLGGRFPHSQVVGIDLSEPLLRIAHQEAQAAAVGDRVRFDKADVHDMPYEDRSFDVVISLNMVHLVDDPIRMLDEMERVLAPGGFLFIADLRRSWLGIVEREIKSALTLEEARDLLRRSRVREGTFSSSLLWWRFEVYGT